MTTLPACINTSGTSSDSQTDQEHGASSHAPTPKTPPEAEVKPAPEPAPPAAVPPADVPLAEPAQLPPPHPAVPEEQTKATLEPKEVQAAALPQPKSEPSAPAPQQVAAVQPPASTPGKKASGESNAPATRDAKKETTKEPSGAATKGQGTKVAVVGDSLAVGIGMTMSQHMSSYQGAGCYPLGKVSTGLISKKLLDWEKTLSDLVAKEKLAAVVVMMGGNDANNPISGKMAGTPEWGEAYREKAESFLRIATKAGIKVLWVGLPAMREAAYNKRVIAVNEAAKAACSKVGGCTYMEASDIFTDASGKYVQAKTIDGKKISLRAKDGVHMTMNGYDLLCRQVLDKLSGDGSLPPKK